MTKPLLSVKQDMSPNHHINRYQFSKTPNCNPFKFLQNYPSLFSFLFSVSFIPSSNLLSGYFDISLNLVAVLAV